jgi:serine/threonine protein kinase
MCLAALDTAAGTRLVGYPLRKLVGAFLGICRGVDYAHQNGVIHLDLKPANILMSGFEEVFVIDWGLARVDDVDDTESLIDLYRNTPRPAATVIDTLAPVTGAVPQGWGRVVGTPAYMAPEQAEGRVNELRPVTDVYGLGGILHYILYGNPPNRGATVEQMLGSCTTSKTRLPLRPGILPRGTRIGSDVRGAMATLEECCLRALDPDPDKRHSSADELIVELSEWLASAPV